jgi:hypothetical protein
VIPGAAVLSPCGTYRYVLRRRIPSVLRWVKPVLLIMLSPSDANAERGDPTIRRCVGFATDWGATVLTVVNLFGLISPDPKVLTSHPDPVGPENDYYLRGEIGAHRMIGRIVAAWGACPFAVPRVQAIRWMLEGVECFGVTKSGMPKHLLYLAKSTPLQPWIPL